MQHNNYFSRTDINILIYNSLHYITTNSALFSCFFSKKTYFQKKFSEREYRAIKKEYYSLHVKI
jgi:hypothetical protein